MLILSFGYLYVSVNSVIENGIYQSGSNQEIKNLSVIWTSKNECKEFLNIIK